ncbi:hypothetical protein AEQU3_00797 [Aequorivita antarctica]|nr:hypothetical protein AEQU3_00797 [Aequorivita antarctica]
MKVIIIIIVLVAFTSCGKSKVQKCIDSKVEQGWSYSDAKEGCEEGYHDSIIKK